MVTLRGGLKKTAAAFKSPEVGIHEVRGSFKGNVYKGPRKSSVYVLTIAFINVVVTKALMMMTRSLV